MSSPLLWIVVPAFIGFVLLFLRRFKLPLHIAGILSALFLAYLAWSLPFEESIRVIPLPSIPSIRVEDTLIILGRRFTLDDASRPSLVFIYLASALWFGGAYTSRINNLFIPSGLLIAGLTTAALAVEPFLYSAVLIFGVGLICIPILNPPGSAVKGGVLRFLIYQALGMAVLLIGGRLLSDVELNPTNIQLAIRVTIFIGLGFAFIAAIFPFHTWIPMVARDSHPYASAYVFFLFPAIVGLLIVNYIEQHRSIGIPLNTGEALRMLAVLMIMVGGVMAAVERNLARIMGFAAIFEIGMSLMALSLVADTGIITPAYGFYFAQQLPRLLGLAVWALSLSYLKESGYSFSIDKIAGAAREKPLISASLVISTFSIAGMPFLGGFPVLISLWSNLLSRAPVIILLAVLGTMGLVLAGIRTLSTLVQVDRKEGKWVVTERIPQVVYLAGGWLMLLIVGTLPQFFIPILTNMAIIHIAP
jgi:formate hydrogenlyase subunit 3/multisubunit Na+/H+ antiporter MnhD subunit